MPHDSAQIVPAGRPLGASTLRASVLPPVCQFHPLGRSDTAGRRLGNASRLLNEQGLLACATQFGRAAFRRAALLVLPFQRGVRKGPGTCGVLCPT